MEENLRGVMNIGNDKSNIFDLLSETLLEELNSSETNTSTQYKLSLTGNELVIITTIEQKISKNITTSSNKTITKEHLLLLENILKNNLAKENVREHSLSRSVDERQHTQFKQANVIQEENPQSTRINTMLIELLKDKQGLDLDKLANELERHKQNKINDNCNKNSRSGEYKAWTDVIPLKSHQTCSPSNVYKEPINSQRESRHMRNTNKINFDCFFSLEKIYREHNKIKQNVRVDFVKILRDRFGYLWFSSAGAAHILFGRLDRDFVETWQAYLTFICNLGILWRGEHVFYGYYKFRAE